MHPFIQCTQGLGTPYVLVDRTGEIITVGLLVTPVPVTQAEFAALLSPSRVDNVIGLLHELLEVGDEKTMPYNDS